MHVWSSLPGKCQPNECMDIPYALIVLKTTVYSVLHTVHSNELSTVHCSVLYTLPRRLSGSYHYSLHCTEQYTVLDNTFYTSAH